MFVLNILIPSGRMKSSDLMFCSVPRIFIVLLLLLLFSKFYFMEIQIGQPPKSFAASAQASGHNI